MAPAMSGDGIPDIPDLFGVVLAGGRSRRFGSDKAAMMIDGQPLLARTVGLLEPHVAQVFVSARKDQRTDTLRSSYPLLIDTVAGLGPAGGLLAAHRARPDAAWLVVACDMPGLDEPTIRRLVLSRQPARAATAYCSPVDGMVEPLCAIYEPATLARFAGNCGASGDMSPRRLLAGSDVEIVEPADIKALANVNRPADRQRVMEGGGEDCSED